MNPTTDTMSVTIRFWAIHIPNEHPRMGFETLREAEAFIQGYGYGCGHDGKDRPCKGALAEWRIEEIN